MLYLYVWYIKCFGKKKTFHATEGIILICRPVPERVKGRAYNCE